MEITINYNGQAVAVEVTLEVYEFLDRADHKAENLSHEQRRHWDGQKRGMLLLSRLNIIEKLPPLPKGFRYPSSGGAGSFLRVLGDSGLVGW